MGLDDTRQQGIARLDHLPHQLPPFDLAGWATEPRPELPPGIYRYGYRPRSEATAKDADVPLGPLLLRAGLNFLVGALIFLEGSPFLQGLLTELGLTDPNSVVVAWLVALAVNGALLLGVIAVFGRMGRWGEVWRRLRQLLSHTVTHEELPDTGARTPTGDPWSALQLGAPAAALRLAGEQANDVDHVRIHQAWRSALADPHLAAAFGEQVAARGGAACPHPSEARELPGGRSRQHDLLTRQVRLGTAENVVKNPAAHRAAGFAMDPQVLGTSLLAVGPAGTGKTTSLARPVAEALCLQALAGAACAVVVGSADADLGPDAWYDVVIGPGDPGSPYGLDLFGGGQTPDEAAARLAEALLPDELALRTESARTALQQVAGPFHAVHGRYPAVRELRALLNGESEAWAALGEELEKTGLSGEYGADLQHRASRHGRADDPGTLLADRLALLDRPAFAADFSGTAGAKPAFAMRVLDQPLRVRVKLPERSHPEVARILSRLVVGQFMQAAAVREERELFAGLVVDDASAAIDQQTVRGIQRMRSVNAGAVLVLRTLVDVPEALRAPLFGAVGCRMAFPGIAPWDGKLFSEAWGTHLVAEQAVTHTPETSGGLLRRSGRLLRKLLTGTAPQTESVTTRNVERHRWSPSDLAHALPAGHAVVSLTSVTGEQVEPLLVDLRG